MKSRFATLAVGLVIALAAVLLLLSLSSSSPPAVPAPTSEKCPAGVCAVVLVNFSGSGSNHSNVSTSCNIPPGSSAWECIKQAVGIENIETQDFGSGLGIFISGLYGVAPNFASCGCFWEFVVNGQSSRVGVSAYIVRDGDDLEWRIGK